MHAFQELAPSLLRRSLTKGRLDGKKFQDFPTFSSLCIFFLPLAGRGEKSFGTRLAGCRWYQKHFIVSVRTRHIRGLPLADALSRRHVCFSVVKRAAGRQTGLNQPPPLSPFLLFFLFLFLYRFSPPAPSAFSRPLSRSTVGPYAPLGP